MADLWMIILVIALMINYGMIIFKLRSVIRSSYTKSRSNVLNYSKSHAQYRKVMRTVGFYPVAFMAQWSMYILYILAWIPKTFEIALIVVTIGNCGGIFNLFLYGPLLLNQIKRVKNKAKRDMTSSKSGRASVTTETTKIEMENASIMESEVKSSNITSVNSDEAGYDSDNVELMQSA